MTDFTEAHAARTNRIADAFLAQIEAAAAAHPEMTERRALLVAAVEARRDELIENAMTKIGDTWGNVWGNMNDRFIDDEIKLAARNAQAKAVA